MSQQLDHVTEADLAAMAAELEIYKVREVFLLFSMGSQFDHLIVQMLSRIGVYCRLANPATMRAEDVARLKPKGIFLSGGPASVVVDPPPFDNKIFDLKIPVLGICLGFQMWAAYRGLRVIHSDHAEYAIQELEIPDDPFTRLFAEVETGTPVQQSHGDIIVASRGLNVLASTENSPVAAGQMGHLWGVQFHPEVSTTKCGAQLMRNFISKICDAHERFPARDEGERKIREIKDKVGRAKVLVALSGGSDSAVMTYVLRGALSPTKLRAVYIQGIDRPDDGLYVRRYFGDWLDVRVVDATEQFVEILAGQLGMHEKRVAMRSVYKEILEREATEFGAGFIAQGTLYTDITESGGGHPGGAKKARIKLHHNTGHKFILPELTPLDDQHKDTARQIGRRIGVPEDLLQRHPFPGPGLVVRIEGEVTAERLAIARAADGIYIEELRAADLYDTVWQAGAVVTQSFTTTTKGDDAGMGVVIALWAVWSVDGMVAQAAELPFDFIRRVSSRLTNEIAQVGAVVYRTSDKPPATIEWG